MAWRYLAITTAMLLWSVNFVWSKEVFAVYSPLTTIFLRLVVAAAFIEILVVLLGARQQVQKQDYGRFLLLSVFQPFFYFLGESYGISLVSSTLSALVIATVPVLFPIVSYFVLKEKVTRIGVGGLVVAFIGLVITIVDPESFTLKYSPVGLFLLLLGVVSGCGYIMLSKDLLGRYETLTVVRVNTIIGALYFLPFFLGFHLSDALKAPLEPAIIGKIVFLGLCCSAMAFIFYNFAIARLRLWQANAFENLLPIFTAVLAFQLLGERLGIREMIGFGVVLGGIVMSQVGDSGE